MDLEGISRLPKLAPLPYVTPSGALALEECHLRAAYRADTSFRAGTASSQAARLGSACHRVLERVAQGALPLASDQAWDSAFDALWMESVGLEANAASASPAESHWPVPERWRNYAMRKVATKTLARKIGGRLGASGVVRVEHAQQAAGGLIRGRADVIRRAPTHEIEDYKSGSVFEEDSSELKAAYRTQMLLYAVLEHEDTGSWPTRASVIPLAGAPVSIDIAPAEAKIAAAQALAALAEYNSAVGTAEHADQLASPTPDHCRFCEFAVLCPGFWASVSSEWRDGQVAAVAGWVVDSETAQRGLVALRLDVQRGSVPSGDWTLAQVDPVRFPQAGGVEGGTAIAVTAVVANDNARALRPTDRTRLVLGAGT
jgi:RecB family exonuclease